MQSDDIDMPRLRVTKEIPLWGIVTVLAAFAAQAIALYYGLQRQVEEQVRQGLRQTEIAADVRTIANDMQKNSLKAVEQQFATSSLEQRVRILESQQTQRTNK